MLVKVHKVGVLDTVSGSEKEELGNMYRIVLACRNVPAHTGAAAARDITEEFMHRPWHQSVSCKWDGSKLILQADSDFDSNGMALLDEFSDAISTCIEDAFDGGIDIVSVSPLPSSRTTRRDPGV